jgi:hypothetical protein
MFAWLSPSTATQRQPKFPDVTLADQFNLTMPPKKLRLCPAFGREQIADCPTAASELWKNAWDAYARNVRLRIFAEESPVAVLTDDGHGMQKSDLFERWLIIGTESKVSDIKPTPMEDRNGLAVRPRQGQKGIEQCLGASRAEPPSRRARDHLLLAAVGDRQH